MTPFFSGRMAEMPLGVRPSMVSAFSPTARIVWLYSSTATTEGSRSTMPFPLI